MAELTTYDFFMDELLDLEKSVHKLVQRDEEISAEKESLIKELRSLKDENEILRIKLEESENKFNDNSKNLDSSLFISENNEVVKEKIDELINKIDNHLRS